MAVKSYLNEQGELRYRVCVDCVSTKVPGVRVTKFDDDFKDEKKAKVRWQELREQAKVELALREQKGRSWGHVVEAFGYAYEMSVGIERPVRQTTAIDTQRGLELFTADWWKRPAADVCRADVQRLMNEMEAKGYSRSRRRSVKAYISVCWAWGLENGHIKGNIHNPTDGVKVGKTRKKDEKQREILTLGQIRKLLDMALAHHHPWHDIWAGALHTGCRNSELFALEWDDVDMETKKISVNKSYCIRFRRVTSTKSGRWRTVPINSELESILKKLRSERNQRLLEERKYVFPRLQGWSRGEQARILRTFCISVGLPSVRFHTLRACFATQLLRANISAATIMKICGWATYETMMEYIRLAGIETEGATEGLKFLTPAEAVSQVVPLFGPRES